MTNLSRALGWAALGLPVFPCYEADTWVGDKLHAMKTPCTAKGLNEGTTDLEVIKKFWTAHPNRLPGVVAGEVLNVLDIDMNEEKGKDGWHSLQENNITLPDTFNVKTRSGGEHYFYKHPEGKKLGPLQNVVLPNGVVLEDVDRRAGRSYFIAWSDEVPFSLDELSEAPEWLCMESGMSSLVPFHGSVSEWLQKLIQGPPDSRVQNAISRIPLEDFNHELMIKRQLEIVRLGADGHSGVKLALESLRDAWLRPPYDSFTYEADWNAALAGAINKFGGSTTPVSESLTETADEKFLSKVQSFIFEEKAKLEAKRILASEDFVGSRVISWDELESNSSSYIVQDLIPNDSICFLVAKRNIGKTFAYIDMVASITFGIPWLGKKTTPIPILIVLGEGRNGFYDRFEAWCEFHSMDIDFIKKNITLVDSANLNNPTSIDLLKEAATNTHAQLIIFDTWAATSGVQSEDDAALNSMTLNFAREICPDATLLFVHHPRKSSQDGSTPIMRGSGALEGRAEVVMTIFQDKDYASTKAGKQQWVSLSTEMDHAGKNRTSATETIRGLYIRPFSKSAVLVHESSSPVSSGSLRVLDFLKSPMTVIEYSHIANVSESTARRNLNEAVRDGLATKTDGAGNLPAIYSPIPSGDDFNSLLESIGGYEGLAKPERKRKGAK